MRMKSSDLLFTTPSVVPWCTENEGQLHFNTPGCILMLLFMKSGMDPYPKYDASTLKDIFPQDGKKCGWNEGYSNVPDGVKYSNTLTQTRPSVAPLFKGATLRVDNLVMEGSVGDKIEALKTRKRHLSS